MQEDVVLADRLEAAPGGLKWRWERRGEERIVEVREATARFSESEELGEIDRACDAINVFVRECEMAKEVGFDFDWAILCEFESNGCPSVPFLKFFLNGKEEVVGFFFVDIEFAVPGDPSGPGTVNFHARENFRDEVADQFGEKDELSWVGAFPRKGNHAGNSARDLNEGVSGCFLVARL